MSSLFFGVFTDMSGQKQIGAASAGQSSQREYHGYAAKDKADDSRLLYVYCEELLPFVSGEIDATNADSGYSISTGKSKTSGTVTTANVLVCTYRDDTKSNSAFPPKVRKGEQVRVYNIGDTDQWYWASAGRNDGARRTDTWRQHISGTLENNADLTDDNTYYIEMDTRGAHHVVISTSGADGEVHTYKFLIDCDKSIVTLSDEIGNTLLMESEIPCVTLKNSANSMIQLNGPDITIACSGKLSITAKGDITTHTTGFMAVETDKQMSFKTNDYFRLESQDEIVVKSEKDVRIVTNKDYKVSAKGTITQSSRLESTYMADGSLTLLSASLAMNRGKDTWEDRWRSWDYQ